MCGDAVEHHVCSINYIGPCLPSPPVGSAFAAEHAKLQLQKESLRELRKECTAKR